MTQFLIVIAGISFAASLFVRMTDPMVPLIAADLGVDVQAAALLGTAFALPWAIMQPVLGPLGDLLLSNTAGITAKVTAPSIIGNINPVV